MSMNAPTPPSLFPTPEEVEALGPERLLLISKEYAPVVVAVGLPDQVTKLYARAKDAAAKLAKNGYPSLDAADQQALHAYVHLVTRPSLAVRDGQVRGVPKTWDVLLGVLAVVESYLRSVGRIDRVDDGVRVRVATGWFVAEKLLMTNNHVVAALCGLNPHSNPAWRSDLDGVVGHFNDRWASDPLSRPTWDPADAPTLDVADAAGRIVHADLHPTEDLALLRVEGVANSAALAIPLSATGPVDADRRMYTLGYPAIQIPGPLHPALVDFLFGASKSGMTKRVAPGLITSPTTSPIEHDATTLGGSSGSPLIDLQSHMAIGLHFNGAYGVTNRAVPLWKQGAFLLGKGVSLA